MLLNNGEQLAVLDMDPRLRRTPRHDEQCQLVR